MAADLHKLRYLVEVVDRGSFSGAATLLGVAQSALSRHVAELEQAYGQRLLHRTGRGVVPTTFTQRFLPRVRNLLEEAEQLSHDMLALRGEVVGRVCLSINHSLADCLLTPFLQEAAASHPNLEITVREGFGDHIDFLLAAGQADLGVTFTGYDEWRDDDEFLMSSEYVLAGASSEPAVMRTVCSLADVTELPLIVAAATSRWRSWVEQIFKARRLSFTIGSEVDAIRSMKDLLCLPGHFGIFSPHFVQREVDAGLVRTTRILDPVVTRRVVLRRAARKPMSHGSKVVAELLREQVRKQVLAGCIKGASLHDPGRDATKSSAS